MSLAMKDPHLHDQTPTLNVIRASIHPINEDTQFEATTKVMRKPLQQHQQSARPQSQDSAEGIPRVLRVIAASLCALAALGMAGAISYPYWPAFIR